MILSLRGKILLFCLVLVAALAAASSLVGWFRQTPVISSVEYIKVPQIKTVTKIEKVVVPGPERIVTVEKEKIVEKEKLPDWIRDNADIQVVATGEIAPYEGTTNVIAVIDTKMGDSEIVARRVPLPFFGFENVKETGLRVGLDRTGELAGAIYGRWSFLRVGNAHLSAYGEADNKGNAGVMLEIGYRF